MKLITRVLFLSVLLGISTGSPLRSKRFLFPLIQASVTKPVLVASPVVKTVVSAPTVSAAEIARQNGAQAGFLPGALSLVGSVLANPAPIVPLLPSIVPAIVSGIGTGIINTVTHPNFSLPALAIPAPVIVPAPIVRFPVVKTVIAAPVVRAPVVFSPPVVKAFIPPPIPVVTKTVVPIALPTVTKTIIGKRRRRSAPLELSQDGPFSGLTQFLLSRPELHRLTPIVFNIPPSERPTNVNIVQKLSDDSSDNTHTLTAHTSFNSSSGQRHGDLLIDSLRHGTSQISSTLGEDFQKDSFVVRHHTYDVYHTDEKHDGNLDNNRYFVTNIYVTKPNGDVISQDDVKPISKPPRPPPKQDYIEKPVEIIEEIQKPSQEVADSVPETHELIQEPYDLHEAPISNEILSLHKVSIIPATEHRKPTNEYRKPTVVSKPVVDNPYQRDRFFTTQVDLSSLGVPTLTDLVSSGSEAVEVIAAPLEKMAPPAFRPRDGSWFEPLKKEIDEVFTGASGGASEIEGEVNALSGDIMRLHEELREVAVSGFKGGSGNSDPNIPNFNPNLGHGHECNHSGDITPSHTHKPTRPTHTHETIPPHETTTPISIIKLTRPGHTHEIIPIQKPKPTLPSHTHEIPLSQKPKPTLPSHTHEIPLIQKPKPTLPSHIHEIPLSQKPKPTLPSYTHEIPPIQKPKPTLSIPTVEIPLIQKPKPTHPVPTHGTTPIQKPKPTLLVPTHETIVIQKPKPTVPIHIQETVPIVKPKPIRPSNIHEVTPPNHKPKPTRPGHTHGVNPVNKPKPIRPIESHETTSNHKPKPTLPSNTRPVHTHETISSTLTNEFSHPDHSHGFIRPDHSHGFIRPDHSHESQHLGHECGQGHGQGSSNFGSKPSTSHSNQKPEFVLLDIEDPLKTDELNSGEKTTSSNPGSTHGQKPSFSHLEHKPGNIRPESFENIAGQDPPIYEPAEFYYVWRERSAKNIFLPRVTNPIRFNSRQGKKVHNLDEPDNTIPNRKSSKVTSFSITSRPPVSYSDRSQTDYYRTVGEIPLESHPFDKPIVYAFNSYGLPANVKK